MTPLSVPSAMIAPHFGRCLGKPQRSSAAAAEAADEAAEAAAKAAAAPASEEEQFHAELLPPHADSDDAVPEPAAAAAALAAATAALAAAKVATAQAALAHAEAEEDAALQKAVGATIFAKKATVVTLATAKAEANAEQDDDSDDEEPLLIVEATFTLSPAGKITNVKDHRRIAEVAKADATLATAEAAAVANAATFAKLEPVLAKAEATH